MHGVVGTIEQGGVTRRRSLRQIAKRLGLIAAVLGILTAGGWYGWSWWTLGRFMETTDDAYVGGEVTTIASKVAHFIDTIAVTDNQEVKAGDLLVKLDDRDYRANRSARRRTSRHRKRRSPIAKRRAGFKARWWSRRPPKSRRRPPKSPAANMTSTAIAR
jgi:multidrug resistance efflux pump